MKKYILGHIKPDLDSTVSALAFAEFLKIKKGEDRIAAIINPINAETKFIFEKFGATSPQLIKSSDLQPEDTVTLVDHNEKDQRLKGLNPDQIYSIIDHHKANLDLNKPIVVTIEPLGSTCTVIYHSKFKLYNVKVEKPLAQLMLSAILSDTVGLKSAITTEKDKQAVKELAQIAEISDIDALVLEIFKAKSNISDLTDEQLVKNDYKVYDFGKKVFIGQLETVEQEEIIKNRKSGILKALEEVKTKEKVSLVFLIISDVLKVNSKIIILGDEEKKIGESAFGSTTTNSVLDVGAKLSRKKEIAPPIEKVLQK